MYGAVCTEFRLHVHGHVHVLLLLHHQQLLQHLPLVNLSTFGVAAERLGGLAWDRLDAISCDLAGKNMDPMIERIMTKNNTLSLQLELEYTFM